MTKALLYAAIVFAAIFLGAFPLLLLRSSEGFATLVAGVFWLALEVGRKRSFPTLFFLYFIGAALRNALNGLSLLMIIPGVSSALVAWDLSRFLLRTKGFDEGKEVKALRRRHCVLLFSVVFAGGALALIPCVVHFAIPFPVLFVLLLAIPLCLRKAVLGFRPEREE